MGQCRFQPSFVLVSVLQCTRWCYSGGLKVWGRNINIQGSWFISYFDACHCYRRDTQQEALAECRRSMCRRTGSVVSRGVRFFVKGAAFSLSPPQQQQQQQLEASRRLSYGVVFTVFTW